MRLYYRLRYVLLILVALLLTRLPAAQAAPSISTGSSADRAAKAQASSADVNPSLDFVGGLSAIAEAAVISGPLAYIGEYDSLTIADISNPAQPLLLSRLPLSGQIKAITIVAKLVYIANYTYGLQIVDASDPLRPVLRGSLALEGNPSGVDVVGNRAYIPAYNYGLKIVDVSDPAQPILLGSSGSYGSITGVKVVGNLAYIAGLGGLIILNISNPANPTFVSLYDTASSGIGNASNLDIAGNLVYLADGGGGLQIIDVTNPASPTLRGSYVQAAFALGVQVAGNMAYVASREYGVFIVDVENPAAPFLRGSFDTSGQAYNIQVIGSRAYVADYTGGLQILDISSPAQPALLGGYGLAGNTNHSWIANNLAYVAAGYDGLRIIDISTPARPLLRGSLAIPGWVFGVQVVGTRAYVGNHENGKLLIIDVGDPAHPTLLGSYQSAQRVMGLEIVGQLAYLADGGGGIEIVDIGNPASPALRGRLDTQSFARDIDVVGDMAYVASEYGGLKIIDVSDPAHPTLRGGLDITPAEGLQVLGDLAYVAFGGCTFTPGEPESCSGGLKIVDVSDPSSPVLRGSYTPGIAKDVRVAGNRAYLAVGNQVHVLDVSDATSPQFLNSTTVQASVEGLQINSGLVVATGYQIGLQIFATTPEFVPSKTTISASGGQASSADGTIQLQFGSNAFAKPTTVLSIGQLLPTQALAGAGNVARRFIAEARAENGAAVTELSQLYTLVLTYTDAELAVQGIPEANLNLMFWNGTAWAKALPCAGCAVDTFNNRIIVRTNRFTQFALVDGQAPTPPPPIKHLVFLPLAAH